MTLEIRPHWKWEVDHIKRQIEGAEETIRVQTQRVVDLKADIVWIEETARTEQDGNCKKVHQV
jgi:hypothetical protein